METSKTLDFTFGVYKTRVCIDTALPTLHTIQKVATGTRFLIVCDEHTRLYADQILEDAESSIPIVQLHAGETYKTWDSVEVIARAAYANSLGRDAIFIGIGGGVLCDLVAFAASVYMRGVKLILIPTTLLAMVDASLGGKTGFDLFDIKNIIGTFRPADTVYMSINCLSTLPNREIRSGLAEIIKTSFIGNEKIANSLPETLSNDSNFWFSSVEHCVIVKGGIVEEDPLEKGQRRALLNLGHTFGHALETVLGLGTLTHGEAVAWGMGRAAALSLKLGYISMSRYTKCIDILNKYEYETKALPLVAAEEGFTDEEFADKILLAMQSDKKKKDGALRFVLFTEQGCDLYSINDTQLIRSVLIGEI